jgi:hypothetical protein
MTCKQTVLRRYAGYIPVRLPFRKAGSDFEQRQFALTANHCIHIVFTQRLIGKQARVPAAENDGHVRPRTLGGFRHTYCAADHGSGENRDPKTERALNLCENLALPIRNHSSVNDADFKSCLKKR